MEELNNTTNFEEMVERIDASELDTIDTFDDVEGSNGLLSKILIGAVVGVTGLGAVAYANRGKIKAWRNKRWEKKCPEGYRIVKVETDVEAGTVLIENVEPEKTDVENNEKKKKKNK